MVQSPMEWPRWPLLPLKHRKRNGHDPGYLGFLFARETPPFVVYVGMMYEVAMKQPKPKTWGDALEGIPTEKYDDIDRLLADWKVD